jgi:hypothetical protein
MKIISVLAITASLALGSAAIAAAQDASAPSADASAAPNPALKSPNDMTHVALAKGHNSFTKGEARARIHKAGYSKIHDLTLDADGLWQGTAMLAGQPVHVALDYKGDVASQ